MLLFIDKVKELYNRWAYPHGKASAEVLAGNKQILLRFYPPGIPPRYPHPFQSALTVDCFGPVGKVVGAVEFDDAIKKIKLGGAELLKHGVELVIYEHKRRWHVIKF